MIHELSKLHQVITAEPYDVDKEMALLVADARTVTALWDSGASSHWLELLCIVLLRRKSAVRPDPTPLL
jgi:hypothetical protein